MTTDNTAMQRTPHVIPTMEELRNELNDARYFTKLDMKHGYRHMERDQALRPITTFCTHRGIQRSRSLTFGINVAVEVFHKEIHQILPDIPGARNVYDDILIYGKTEREHNMAFIKILQHLQNCEPTLNHQKCIFGVLKVEFFGFIFSAQGAAPTHSQTTTLLNATRPTTTAEVKLFLGMVNFSVYFIPKLSSTTAPLQAPAMKNAKFMVKQLRASL